MQNSFESYYPCLLKETNKPKKSFVMTREENTIKSWFGGSYWWINWGRRDEDQTEICDNTRTSKWNKIEIISYSFLYFPKGNCLSLLLINCLFGAGATFFVDFTNCSIKKRDQVWESFKYSVHYFVFQDCILKCTNVGQCIKKLSHDLPPLI